MSTFSFRPKRKFVQKTYLDFLVSNVNLYCKSRHTVQICVWRKGKSGHTGENLDGQKLLRVSNSGSKTLKANGVGDEMENHGWQFKAHS